MTNQLKQAAKVAAIASFLIAPSGTLVFATPSVPQKAAGGSIDVSTSWAKQFDRTVRNIKDRQTPTTHYQWRWWQDYSR